MLVEECISDLVYVTCRLLKYRDGISMYSPTVLVEEYISEVGYWYELLGYW